MTFTWITFRNGNRNEKLITKCENYDFCDDSGLISLRNKLPMLQVATGDDG